MGVEASGERGQPVPGQRARGADLGPWWAGGGQASKVMAAHDRSWVKIQSSRWTQGGCLRGVGATR